MRPWFEIGEWALGDEEAKRRVQLAGLKIASYQLNAGGEAILTGEDLYRNLSISVLDADYCPFEVEGDVEQGHVLERRACPGIPAPLVAVAANQVAGVASVAATGTGALGVNDGCAGSAGEEETIGEAAASGLGGVAANGCSVSEPDAGSLAAGGVGL